MAYNDVNRQLQLLLGRDATADEISFFDKFIQQEGLTPYEIGQAIQSMPEYQSRALNRDMASYGAELAKSDEGILNQAAAIGQSRFAQLGRPVTSAQAGALAQAGQNLAQQRQSALAAFYGQGLNVKRSLGQSQGQGALERGYGLRDEAREREYQLQDRNYMKEMYDQYTARQARAQRSGALGSTLGAIGGAAIGGYFGGGPGAYLGSRAGSSFGGNAGGLF
jgi:hypothetical protein